MNEPPIFLDIERITAAFFFTDHKIILSQLQTGCHRSEYSCSPPQNRFGIGGEGEIGFVADERDKDGILIDDHGATAAKSFMNRNMSRKFIKMDKRIGFARDSHDDRRVGANIDETMVLVVV